MKTRMKSLIAVTASVTFVLVPFDPANAQNQRSLPQGNAFSGAFLEINTGLVDNHMVNLKGNDTINYTVSFTSTDRNLRSNATETGTRSSVSSMGGEDKRGAGYRLTLGYGVTSGSFNFAPSLFYMPNTFTVGGATLKGTWGAQVQPGFYIPLNKRYLHGLLLYGTAGFASTEVTQSMGAPQSEDLCTPEIRRNDLFLGSGTDVVYYPPHCSNERFPEERQASRTDRLNGLVLGVGTKLAFSEHIYGVFDFTYILYGKLKDIDFHQTKQLNETDIPVGRSPNADGSESLVSKDYHGNWSRDYSASGARIRQSFISIGIGFRFF